MLVIHNRVSAFGAVDITERDKALLATEPPTLKSRERANEVGTFLGQLLHANNINREGRDEIIGDVLYRPGNNFPHVINGTVAHAALMGYAIAEMKAVDVIQTTSAGVTT